MKVLLLANKVPYPAQDGSSIAIRSMVRALSLNGCDACLMALNTRKHFRPRREIEAALPDHLDFSDIPANTNVTPMGLLRNLLSGKAYHVSRFYKRNFARQLRRKLQSEEFEIIQLEGLSMAVYLPLIRRYSKARVVLRAHNIEYQIWDRHVQHESHALRKLYLSIQVSRLRSFEECAFRSVDALVFITEEDRRRYGELGISTPSTAIPCGIDPEEYQITTHSAEYDISYLASFDWLPNQQGMDWFMEKVWPLLRQKRPETTFLLGGRGMPMHFEKFASQGIQLQGEVEEAHEFLQRGRVAIVPLLAGSGMRIKILENLALGMPTVSTRIGAEGISLRDGEEIALADSPAAFAERLIALVEQPQLRRQMSEKARQCAVEHYSNQKLGAALKEFYREV